MPIVHDPATGRFSRGSGGGARSEGHLTAKIQNLRGRLFTAPKGSATHKRLTSELKHTEGTLGKYKELQGSITKLRSQAFTAPAGSTRRKRLESQISKQQKEFESL